MDSAVVIDASVWISGWMRPDVNHADSRAWLDQYTAAGGVMLAPAFLTVEVGAAVVRATQDILRTERLIQQLYAAPNLSLQPLETHLIVAATRTAVSLSLRAGDALYVALADQLRIPLVSWDREQRLRGGRIIPTYSPATYIF